MAITAPIPLPESGMDAFMGAAQGSQNILNGIMQRKLLEAQAQRQQAMAQLPFGGANVPGPAGQIVGLEMVKRFYGENSPQYAAAKQAFDASMRSTGARADYENALTKSMGIRYTTPQGRQIIEQSNVSQGYSPAGTPIGQPIAPGQAPYNPDAINNQQNTNNPILNAYKLHQMKQNVPAQVLNRNLFASNIEKTFNNLNPDDLTSYAGLKGVTDRAKDAALAASGNAPTRYVKYQQALTASNLLAKQVRQFYGTSITPEMDNQLNSLTNPGTWINNPQIAKAKFNKFKSILGQEMQTYRQATQGTGIYTGQNNNTAQSNDPLGIR